MLGRFIFLVSVGVIVAWCVGCFASQFVGLLTPDQMKVLIVFLLVLFGISAAVIVSTNQ